MNRGFQLKIFTSYNNFIKSIQLMKKQLFKKLFSRNKDNNIHPEDNNQTIEDLKIGILQNIGKCVVHFQIVEMQLYNILKQSTKADLSTDNELLKVLEKDTMGRLKNLLKDNVVLPTEFETKLSLFVDKRNEIIHGLIKSDDFSLDDPIMLASTFYRIYNIRQEARELSIFFSDVNFEVFKGKIDISQHKKLTTIITEMYSKNN